MPNHKAAQHHEKSNPREHLLTTAITLFSARGFDGTSINDIVNHAGVSKRMVYHYFKNKSLLYQESLSQAYNKLRSYEQRAMSGVTTLETAVKHLVRVYFYFPREQPLYASLLRWVNINRGRGLENNPFPLTKDSVIKPLKALIKKEADGITWRKDLRAPHLLITIIGISQVYMSHRYTLSYGLNIDLGTDAAIKRGMANAELYLLVGMRPRQPHSPRSPANKTNMNEKDS